MDQFEELLQCPVCQEPINTAMGLRNCSHVFCSLCIRRSLEFAQECPMCRTKATTHDLIHVRHIDHIIQQWKSFKEKNIIAQAKPEEPSASTNANEKDASDATVAQDVPLPPRHLACPVCSRHIREEDINGHLDRCLSDSSKPQTPAKPHSHSASHQNQPPKQRLPNLVYSIMNDKQVKKLCSEHHLPTNGSKEELVRRHKELVLLYNASCDSGSPLSIRDCAAQVLENEQKAARKGKLLAELKVVHAENILDGAKRAADREEDVYERAAKRFKETIVDAGEYRVLYSTVVEAPFYFHIPTQTGSFSRPNSLAEPLPHDDVAEEAMQS